jgi:NitT/TauT family transport system substrate-binding protein
MPLLEHGRWGSDRVAAAADVWSESGRFRIPSLTAGSKLHGGIKAREAITDVVIARLSAFTYFWSFLMRPTLSSRTLRRFTGFLLCLSLGLGSAGAARAEVKVGLSDWPGWVAWYIAEQKGFFKKHGAKVKLVWFANYTDSIAALSAGQLDANSQTWSDTMTPLSKRVDVKAVLVNDNSFGNDALMVGPKIKSFADLKGKSVALEQFSVSHFVLATALAKNGLGINDVKVVNLTAGDAAAAFLAGRVDATVVWNPWVSKIESSGKGRALFTSKDMPGLVPDLLVAHGKALADKGKRAELVGMVRAWFDTEAFIRANPAEAVKIMSKVVSIKPDEYLTWGCRA